MPKKIKSPYSPKRKNLTKEEIAQKMKNVELAKRLRAFVRDQFYPQLCKASTSIEDAKYLLSSFSNMVMEQFLSKMKEIKFSELKLEDKLDAKSPQYEEYKNLLTLFGEEDVYSTRELIEGMKGEIEALITDEMKARKLESLKTNFYAE